MAAVAIARHTVQPQANQMTNCLLLLDDNDVERIKIEFEKADKDCSGALGEGELMEMWKAVWPGLPNKDLREMSDNMFEDLDPNHDGFVSWKEFEQFFAQIRDRSEWSAVDWMVYGRYLDREPTLREAVWHIMDTNNDTYSEINPLVLKIRKAFFLFSTAIVFASVIVLIIESDAAPDSKLRDKIVPGEAFCMLIFIIELIVRACSAPDRRRFWAKIQTVIDIVAIMPFLIGSVDPRGNQPSGPDKTAVVQALRWIQLTRLLRLMKLWRLGNQFTTVKVLAIALHRIYRSLAVALLGINCCNIIFFAGFISLAERDDAYWDEDTAQWLRGVNSTYPDAGGPIVFQSMGVSMWWGIVTSTTVGYGDMFPVTNPGKGVAASMMCVSIVLMAFPLTLLADSFSKVCAELDKKMGAKARSEIFSAHIIAGKQANADVFNEQMKDTMGGASTAIAEKVGIGGLPTPDDALATENSWFASGGIAKVQKKNLIKERKSIAVGKGVGFFGGKVPIPGTATPPPGSTTPAEEAAKTDPAADGGSCREDATLRGGAADGTSPPRGRATSPEQGQPEQGGFLQGMAMSSQRRGRGDSNPNPLAAGGGLHRGSVDSRDALVPGAVEIETVGGEAAGDSGALEGRPRRSSLAPPKDGKVVTDRIEKRMAELKQLLARQEQILVRRGGVQVQELELLQMLAGRMSKQEDVLRDVAARVRDLSGRMPGHESCLREIHAHVARGAYTATMGAAMHGAAPAMQRRGSVGEDARAVGVAAGVAAAGSWFQPPGQLVPGGGGAAGAPGAAVAQGQGQPGAPHSGVFRHASVGGWQ